MIPLRLVVASTVILSGCASSGPSLPSFDYPLGEPIVQAAETHAADESPEHDVAPADEVVADETLVSKTRTTAASPDEPSADDALQTLEEAFRHDPSGESAATGATEGLQSYDLIDPFERWTPRSESNIGLLRTPAMDMVHASAPTAPHPGKRPKQPPTPLRANTEHQRTHYRIPDAEVNLLGPVQAVAFPVALGNRPEFDEQHIQDNWLDRYSSYLSLLSQQTLRISTDLHPFIGDASMSTGELAAILREDDRAGAWVKGIVDHWATQVDLAQYDNDGPDGAPMSGDDDGFVDLVLIPVADPDEHLSVTRIDLDHQVGVGIDRETPLGIRAAYIIPVHNGKLEQDSSHLRDLVRESIGFFGLQTRRPFFPPPHDRMLATGPRIALGWTPSVPLASDESVALDSQSPTLTVSARRGDPLVLEMGSDGLYISRTATRNRDYSTSAFRFVPMGQPAILRYRLGLIRSTVIEVEWDGTAAVIHKR